MAAEGDFGGGRGELSFGVRQRAVKDKFRVAEAKRIWWLVAECGWRLQESCSDQLGHVLTDPRKNSRVLLNSFKHQGGVVKVH